MAAMYIRSIKRRAHRRDLTNPECAIEVQLAIRLFFATLRKLLGRNSEFMITNTAVTLNASQKQRLVEELRRRRAVQPCNRCGHANFELLDYVFSIPAATADGIGGALAPSFPLAATACTNCGAVNYHIAGILIPLRELGLA
jgi:hypothetical protein